MQSQFVVKLCDFLVFLHLLGLFSYVFSCLRRTILQRCCLAFCRAFEVAVPHLQIMLDRHPRGITQPEGDDVRRKFFRQLRLPGAARHVEQTRS